LKETGGVGWSNEGGRGMEMEKEEVERNPRHLMSPPIIIIILINRFV